MALARDDRWIADAQGRALAGASIYWCAQPATISTVPPPSPLLTTFADLGGVTLLPQPVVTDGFGHANAYLDDSLFYTLVIYHPLFAPNALYGGAPVQVLIDQHLGGGGGGGSLYVPFEGVPTGTIDGTNRQFTLTNAGVPLTVNPVQAEVVLNMPLIPGLGYNLIGTLVIYANAPQPASGGSPADAIYARGWTPA